MRSIEEIFFEDEWDAGVEEALRAALQSARDEYLTFNRTNIRIDRAASTVTIEDELDPDVEATLSIDDFVGRFPTG